MERRYSDLAVGIERRVGTDPPYITGYAARFYDPDDEGTEFELWAYDNDRCVERIMPGAFSDFLVPQVADGIDCCALYNHNPDHLLGRQSAGTLTLSQDAKGLRYSITPPDSPLAKGVLASIQRGDLKGSSFSFDVDREGQRWVSQNGLTVREIHRVSKLMDVGPVTFPAYGSTTAGARTAGHVEEARAAWQAWRTEAKRGLEQRAYLNLARLRLRLASIDE